MTDQQYLNQLVMELKGKITDTVVTTFNGRSGNILPVNNDYSINQITNSSVLADSNNIDFLNIQNGDVLTYSTVNFKWKNQAPTFSVSSVFGRTGAVVATEGDYNLTQLGDVTLTLPNNNQLLKYNGAQWVNSTVDRYITQSFGTDVNLTPSIFLKPGIGTGDNNFYHNCAVVPIACTATGLTATVSAAPGITKQWIFYLYVNNVVTFQISVTDLNVTNSITFTQPLNQGDLISIFTNQVLGPTAATGYVSVLMTI